MAVPVVQTLSPNASGNVVDGVVVDRPTGTADGDLLILIAHGSVPTNSGNAPGINTPSGWTLVDTTFLNSTIGARGNRIAVFSKVASSEPANYTITFTNGFSTATGA